MDSNRIIIDKLLHSDLTVYTNQQYMSDMVLSIKQEKDPDIALLKTAAFTLRNMARYMANSTREGRYMDLYWNSIFVLAPYDFDSYMLYMERDRLPSSRFYLPRRIQLQKIGAIKMLQDLEDGIIKIGALSLPPGVGKTTLGEFYISWIIGRSPEDCNIFASHSSGIDRMFYDSVDAMTNSAEYLWHDIFPGAKRQSTNAKEMQINFGRYKPFKSLSCVSVGQNLAGKVRADHLLYCDDLVSGIEEAVSKPRLDKVWQSYTVDLLQRRKDNCKELHVATRWSVHDPIGRLKLKYEGNDSARFLAVPDIDPETGESNFDYQYGVGFSKQYFIDIGETMDNVSYRSLFKNEPIEREGLLYQEDSVRRFFSMPDKEPDAILAICDSKNKGTDYMFMPVFYQYGLDYYMADCICDDNSDYDIQYRRLSDMIKQHRIQRVEFETNNGGDRIAKSVSDLIRGESNCVITTHYTTQNKETKIIVNAEWVKKHCLFKDSSMYAPRDDYGRAMGFLMSYTVAGKNAHDDVPDGLAQFAMFTDNLVPVNAQLYNSPF